MTSQPQRRIALIVERTEPPGLAPAITNAYGLTARESEVVRHLLQGLSTKQIATALGILPYTVQEHFTAIFDKVGVRSRRQLVGKVFSQVYEPRIRQRLYFGSGGWSGPASGATGAGRLKN